MPPTKTLLETGVPGFDRLLGGGLPTRQSLLITGQPGSGKTVLASQIAFNVAARGEHVVVATTTSESQGDLLDDLSGFSFFSQPAVGEELFFLSIYPWLKKGAKEARDVLVDTVRERKAKLLVIDGMRSIRDLWQDEAKLREFFYELAVGLSAAECTAIFVTEYPLTKLIEYAESTTVDGVISLTNEPAGSRRVRRAEVVKLRGMRHLTGQHLLKMSDDGVSIIPRLESIIEADVDHRPSSARATFGLPELDAILHGGVPKNTSVLLAGGGGVGKTILGLHFAAAGAKANEKALLYSFTEPRGSLIDRARRVNLELQPLLDSGAVTIEFRPSLEDEADLIVQRLLRQIERDRISRLIFEDVDNLERALGDPDRARAFLSALLIELRKLGVTSLFTRKISKVVGPEIDFSDTALASIAENLFFVRQVELRGRLHRVLSILNLRDSAYDPSLREFQILDQGVKVLKPFDSAEGLLTGLARPIGPLTPTDSR